MSTLYMERFAYTPTETQGRLWGPDGEILWTIERPWVAGPHPGGMPFESCIPDGKYQLVPHTRPRDGAEVVALVNPDLGVWYQKDDRPDIWGRYLVLIHAGNFSQDVVGCLAPGLSRTIHENRVMVTSSRAAMGQLNVRSYDSMVIAPYGGAR